MGNSPSHPATGQCHRDPQGNDNGVPHLTRAAPAEHRVGPARKTGAGLCDSEPPGDQVPCDGGRQTRRRLNGEASLEATLPLRTQVQEDGAGQARDLWAARED